MMNGRPIYDSWDVQKLIHKKYPFIPYFIIKRVLFAEEVYMHKSGIIDYRPSLDWWQFPRKKR